MALHASYVCHYSLYHSGCGAYCVIFLLARPRCVRFGVSRGDRVGFMMALYTRFSTTLKAHSYLDGVRLGDSVADKCLIENFGTLVTRKL